MALPNQVSCVRFKAFWKISLDWRWAAAIIKMVMPLCWIAK
jgi:hypothetical protein